jgi:hypothetical protein
MCRGELTKVYGYVFLLVEPATFKGGKGEAFILSKKTSRWKLASRNQNIQNLKYSRYRPNRTLRFGNRNIQFSQGLVRARVYKVIVFHSSHLGF